MDNGTFDTVTRSLSTAGSGRTTRRGMTRVLGGLALGGPLALLGRSHAEATCKKLCGACKRCRKGKCKPAPAGTACTGGTCQGGVCVPEATPPPPAPPAPQPPPAPPACGSGGPCRVFLSSTLHGGNLGGLSGADAICQGLAKDANLPGTYRAWLSDRTSSPESRFVPSTGPYRLVDGTTIAANFTDLIDGTLAAPIDVTETGGGTGGESATWTHTVIDGTPGGLDKVNCENWSTSAATGAHGNIGLATSTNPAWTDVGSSLCNVPRHLYCFQQS